MLTLFMPTAAPILLQSAPVLDELRLGAARVLIAVLAVLLIWVARNLISRLLLFPVRRIARRTRATWDDRVLDSVEGPSRLIALALALFVAARILDVDLSIDGFITNLSRTLVLLAVLVIVYRLVDLLTPSGRFSRVTGLSLDDRLVPFVRTGLRFVVIVIGLVIVLQEWDYDVNGLLASVGIGALAVSLAAKDTVENVFGFGAIVGDNPFQVGDYIKTPDVEGIVEHVGFRSTRVRQLNQAVVTVPNGKIATAAVLNWSRLSKRWYDHTIGIEYNVTSAEIRTLVARIHEMLRQREVVDPESVLVHFINFGENSLDILVRCYIRLSNWGEFTAEKEQIHLAIMDIMEALGISIAFPTRSLYIEQMPFPNETPARAAAVPAAAPAPNPNYPQGGDGEDAR